MLTFFANFSGITFSMCGSGLGYPSQTGRTAPFRWWFSFVAQGMPLAFLFVGSLLIPSERTSVWIGRSLVCDAYSLFFVQCPGHQNNEQREPGHRSVRRGRTYDRGPGSRLWFLRSSNHSPLTSSVMTYQVITYQVPVKTPRNRVPDMNTCCQRSRCRWAASRGADTVAVAVAVAASSPSPRRPASQTSNIYKS